MKKPTSQSVNNKLIQKSQTFSEVTHISDRRYRFQTAALVRQLNLEVFKVYPCGVGQTHNYKQCPNYHNAKDRKRYGHNYHSTLCPAIKNNQKCPQGDNCPYAHSLVEEHYHPQEYKKKFCSHFPNSISECPYQEYCSYAHSEEEILTPLIHNYEEDDDFYMFYYKTEKCPFNLTKHDPALCVYYHNLQDYRRKPHQYHYQPLHCYNWKMKEHIDEYLKGCQMGPHCNMCHGWKELQYHPSYYKTNKCDNPTCKKGSCYNYHSQKEKRTIDPHVLSGAFKYVPKNRITEGVFKSNLQGGFLPKHDHLAHKHDRPSHKQDNDKFAQCKSSEGGYKGSFLGKQDKQSKTVAYPKKYLQETEHKTNTLVMVKEKSVEFQEKQSWIVGKSMVHSDEQQEEEVGREESVGEEQVQQDQQMEKQVRALVD